MNEVLGRAQTLLSFSNELEENLSADGAGGVAGLIDRFQEVQREVAAIDDDRLARASREIHGLIHSLAGVGEQIDQLLSIKQTLPGSKPDAVREELR